MRSWIVSLTLALGSSLIPAMSATSATSATSPEPAVPTPPVSPPLAQEYAVRDVNFADGGTGTGFFLYSTSSGRAEYWSLSLRGGHTSVFPPVEFDPSNSTELTVGLGNPVTTFIFHSSATSRAFRFTPISRLEDDLNATVPLDLHTAFNGSGGVDCFDCAPFRLINGGQLVPVLTDSIDGKAEKPLLRMQAHAVFQDGLIGDKSLALYKSGKAVLVKFLGSAVVDALTPADFARVGQELLAAQVAFARDCVLTPQGGLDLTVRLTWFGEGTRTNHLTVTTGGTSTCPAPLKTLVEELALRLQVHGQS
jgi:hypothetical protein